MDIIEFLKSPSVREAVAQREITDSKNLEASYNLFTISSYNSYLENFHSDIIGSLLNPYANHKQGSDFLFIFIDFLNNFHDLRIDKNDFSNADVTRETGKLDVWIKDSSSRKSIIIENKINNAADMEDQLDRYWRYAQTKNSYAVEAIVYLTIDGRKKAPTAQNPINHIVRNIEALSSEPNNLVLGWLEPCLAVATNLDSSTFIYQYIKLIKHLANRSMETTTMLELYDFISAENGFQTLDTIVTMYREMTQFRADQFSKQVTHNGPFRKQSRYKPMYILFEDYFYQDNRLKLDVWFVENGGAEIVFWNVTTSGINGRQVLTERLNEIGMTDAFTDEVCYNGNGYRKHFVVGSEHTSMTALDAAVVAFVKDFLAKLSIS